MSETKTETPTEALNGFTQRLEKAFQEAIELKLKAMEKRFDEMIDAKLKAKEIEAESALRKSFGLEADPVVHQSDLISAIRKASVENTEKQRSPAASEKANPDGNNPTNPIDQLFNEFNGVKA